MATAIAAAAIFGTSAFAEERPQNNTAGQAVQEVVHQDRQWRNRDQRQTQQPSTETQRVDRRSGQTGTQNGQRDRANQNQNQNWDRSRQTETQTWQRDRANQNQNQNRDRSRQTETQTWQRDRANQDQNQNWDRSRTNTQQYDRNRTNGSQYDRGRTNTQQYDRGRTNQNRGYDRGRSNQSNQSYDRGRTSNGYRYDNHGYRYDNRGFGDRYDNRGRRSFLGEGRVTRYAHERGGYRVWVDGGLYPFWIPEARWSLFPLRVGLSIRLGGWYDPLGYVDVYDVGPYAYGGGAYNTSGDLRGVVESVDYRRGTVVVRDDISGSFVTAVMRGPAMGDFRPGDYVDFGGDWTRNGVFQAYQILNVGDGGNDGGRY